MGPCQLMTDCGSLLRGLLTACQHAWLWSTVFTRAAGDTFRSICCLPCLRELLMAMQHVCRSDLLLCTAGLSCKGSDFLYWDFDCECNACYFLLHMHAVVYA